MFSAIKSIRHTLRIKHSQPLLQKPGVQYFNPEQNIKKLEINPAIFSRLKTVKDKIYKRTLNERILLFKKTFNNLVIELRNEIKHNMKALTSKEILRIRQLYNSIKIARIVLSRPSVDPIENKTNNFINEGLTAVNFKNNNDLVPDKVIPPVSMKTSLKENTETIIEDSLGGCEPIEKVKLTLNLFEDTMGTYSDVYKHEISKPLTGQSNEHA